MPRIVVHIGTHRTGSTALQHFLADNSALLRENGVHYVGAGRGGGNPENHHILAMALRRGDPGPAQEVIRELSGSSASTAVVSSEMLAEFDSSGPLAELFDGRPVEIVAFLRRQDLRIESAYRQKVKDPTARRSTTIWEMPDVRQFVWKHDYSLLLDPFVRRFGTGAVRVIPYDEPRDPTFVYRAFLEVLGVRWTDSFVAPTRLARNIGLHLDCMEVKRLINRHPLPLEGDLAVARALEQVSVTLPPHPVRHLLSPEHRAAIRRWYAPGNERLAATYLGGSQAFTPPAVEEVAWEPYRGLTDDASTAIREALRLEPALDRIVHRHARARRSRRDWRRAARAMDNDRRRLAGDPDLTPAGSPPPSA